MFVVWKKLQRLQPHIKKLCRPVSDMSNKITQARDNLTNAQEDLSTDIMNVEKFNKVKELSESLVNLQELEESMLRQRAKIDWLRLSDGNNKYFHVAIKIRNQTNGIKKIMRNDGTYTTDQKAIETKVVAFYRNLMGKASGDLEGVDISAM